MVQMSSFLYVKPHNLSSQWCHLFRIWVRKYHMPERNESDRDISQYRPDLDDKAARARHLQRGSCSYNSAVFTINKESYELSVLGR